MTHLVPHEFQTGFSNSVSLCRVWARREHRDPVIQLFTIITSICSSIGAFPGAVLLACHHILILTEEPPWCLLLINPSRCDEPELWSITTIMDLGATSLLGINNDIMIGKAQYVIDQKRILLSLKNDTSIDRQLQLMLGWDTSLTYSWPIRYICIAQQSYVSFIYSEP